MMTTKQNAVLSKIYFLTINYYCGDLVRILAETILSKGDASTHLVIVNNSPKDDLSDCSQRYSMLELINAKNNVGFGAGCNLGIDFIYEQDPDGIIWLINPDAKLLPGALPSVRRTLAESPRTALLGTRICDQNGCIWFDQGTFNPWLGTLKHKDVGRSNICSSESDEICLSEPTDWISGCSFILNLKALSIKPEFDPQIFLDYEDAELCLRLRQAGYIVRVTKDVLVEHAISAITGQAPRAKYRHATFSKLYLLHKHASTLGLTLNIMYYSIKPFLMLGSDLLQAQGRWAGLCDYFTWCLRKSLRSKGIRHPRTTFTSRT